MDGSSYHSAAYAHHRAKAAAYANKAARHAARASAHRSHFGVLSYQEAALLRRRSDEFDAMTSHDSVSRAWTAFHKLPAGNPDKRAMYRSARGRELLQQMKFDGLQKRASEEARGLDEGQGYGGPDIVQTWGQFFDTEVERSRATSARFGAPSFMDTTARCGECGQQYTYNEYTNPDVFLGFCSQKCKEDNYDRYSSYD